MNRNSRTFLTAAMILAGISGIAAADPPGLKTLPIGAPAPDFRLPGVDGKTYSLADFADAKVLVVVFTCNHCPTAQAYEERIAKLHADYQRQGAWPWWPISPNDPAAVRLDELGYTDLGDSFEEMKIRAKEHGFQFPYLYDGETQETATAYGVLATPHVFIFDADRKLRYVGRIDDSEVKAVKSHDARNAIDALLAGRPVPVAKTRVFGCSTKWSDKQADARESLEKWDAEPVTLEPIDLEGVEGSPATTRRSSSLVNVWATWCGPCVGRAARVGHDQPDVPQPALRDGHDQPGRPRQARRGPARCSRRTTSRRPTTCSTGRPRQVRRGARPEWPGPVPYTVLIAPGGKVIYRKAGHDRPAGGQAGHRRLPGARLTRALAPRLNGHGGDASGAHGGRPGGDLRGDYRARPTRPSVGSCSSSATRWR